MRITVRITGRAYHVSGGVPESLDFPRPPTVAEAIGSIQGFLPDGEALPASCLVIVSGRHVGTLAAHESRVLADGDQLELIAPVAGG